MVVIVEVVLVVVVLVLSQGGPAVAKRRVSPAIERVEGDHVGESRDGSCFSRDLL